MATREQIMELWPELDWIENEDIREKTLATWALAFERSPLEPQDLLDMPFTLHVPNCEVSFMAHKRLVVHLALDSAKKIEEFMGDAMPIDRDILISGAILADVGKLLEYEKTDGELKQSRRGKYLRHPFTGVGRVDIAPPIDRAVKGPESVRLGRRQGDASQQRGRVQDRRAVLTWRALARLLAVGGRRLTGHRVVLIKVRAEQHLIGLIGHSGVIDEPLEGPRDDIAVEVDRPFSVALQLPTLFDRLGDDHHLTARRRRVGEDHFSAVGCLGEPDRVTGTDTTRDRVTAARRRPERVAR